MYFYVGTSPKDAYMLPDSTHIMINARQYWNPKRRRWTRHGNPTRGGRVFLDSGGFVFFNDYGRYPFSPARYMNLVAYLQPHFYASLDYPCEPTITSQLAQTTITERINATVRNALALADMETMVPGSQLVPVIQGWTVEEYRYCLDRYAEAGMIRPYMAVGSLCTRSRNDEIAAVIRNVHNYAAGLGVERLHMFGLKRSEALDPVHDLIHSRDSAAVYFAPNAEMKRKWGGRRFAPNRKAKREAVAHWLEGLTRKGLIWQA